MRLQIVIYIVIWYFYLVVCFDASNEDLMRGSGKLLSISNNNVSVIGEDTATNEAYLSQFMKSQKGEDIYAIRNYFWDVRGGVAVESGALDGLRYSNSFIFSHLLQWRSVLVEASPDQFGKLSRNRPEAISINAALCKDTRSLHWLNTWPPQERGIFEFMRSSKQKRKKIKEMKRRYENVFSLNGQFNQTILDLELKKVPCLKFTDLMLQIGIHRVNIWFLDVEGAEYVVLQGWDPEIIHVDVLVVETPTKEMMKPMLNLFDRINYKCDIVSDKYNIWCTAPDFVPKIKLGKQ